MSLHHPKPNHNHAAEYQCSGVPFLSSSARNGVTTAGVKVSFPYVTRWVQVFCHADAAKELRVGFTVIGISDELERNFVLVPTGTCTPRLEVKCTEIHLRSDTSTSGYSLIAGLTNVGPSQFFTMSGSNGVAGVG